MATRFAVFDIDGTIVRWQLIHATFDELGRMGKLRPDDYAAIKAARLNWKTRDQEEGFMAYQRKWIEIVTRNTDTISAADFDIASQRVFTEYKDQVYRYTRDLIRQLKADDYLLFAISGSQQEVVRLLAAYYGFDDYLATVFEQANGRLTGKARIIKGDKGALVRQLMHKHGVGQEGSVAVGDSEGDTDMLEAVERPIAFNPSKKLFRHAAANGWQVVLERKNMIYELAAGPDGYHLEHTNA